QERLLEPGDAGVGLTHQRLAKLLLVLLLDLDPSDRAVHALPLPIDCREASPGRRPSPTPSEHAATTVGEQSREQHEDNSTRDRPQPGVLVHGVRTDDQTPDPEAEER